MLVRKNSYEVQERSSLEAFLRKRCLFFNRVSLADFISQKRVYVNGTLCLDAARELVPGESVVLHTPQSFEPPVDECVAVLYEDEAILVVNKPAPLPVHPAGRHYFNTLTKLLVRKGLAKEESLFPVQRLDRETSGVLVFAKSATLAAQLAKQFVKRDVEKEYVAVVRGIFSDALGVIDKPLQKRQEGEIRDKMCISDSGLPAVTSYEVLATTSSVSLLLLRPLTGRRHQIRAHLASLGHPLLGEKMYVSDTSLFLKFTADPLSVSDEELITSLGAPRQFLHALRLSFVHPKKAVKMSFFAPLAKDIVSFCEKTSLDISKIKK